MKVHPALVAAVLFLSTCTADPSHGPGAVGAGVTGDVLEVLDGDSLVVRLPSGEERVRLIGVNAPERDECYGDEAADTLRTLVAGRRVQLVTDVEPRDQYERLLAYVYVGRRLVNEHLARSGTVLARRYEPNTAFQERLETAAAAARAEQLGLWSRCISSRFAEIVIGEVHADPPGADQEDLNGEWIILRNASAFPVGLGGWMVRDESSLHRFRFPPGAVLDTHGELIVFSGCGDDQPGRLYWCAIGPVWDNSGDTAFLLDADGLMVAVLSY